MTAVTLFAEAPDLADDDYVVVGLATCFKKDAGEVQQFTILEPVPSAYLEALLKGVPTSYQSLHAMTLGELITAEGNPQLPTAAQAAGAHLSQNFVERSLAAARTYKSRPSAQTLVPLGTETQKLNYSTEKKRLLNADHVVTAEDNVKQHQYTHMTL
ncbi:MAG: hypothetical protein AAF921_04530 [Cyanobacteria bacterium P01_D01_bin.44]